MPWFVALAIGVVTVALVAHGWRRFSVYAAERDWIYHEKHNPRPKGMGTLGMLETIYQPSLEHVVEERASQQARGSQDESGDLPLDDEAE